jgi:hypothetical protein
MQEEQHVMQKKEHEMQQEKHQMQKELHNIKIEKNKRREARRKELLENPPVINRLFRG